MSPGSPMTGRKRPPRKLISLSGVRTIRGAVSRWRVGSRSSQTPAGSTVWSSTEMISGNVLAWVSMAPTVARI